MAELPNTASLPPPAPLSNLLSCISPYQVCPWTLFLTMSLTLLKGLMPHVPAMLPLLVSDPEMRSRAEETFMSPEFQENIEQYFVQNIKVSVMSNAHHPVQEWEAGIYSKRSKPHNHPAAIQTAL